MTIQFRGFSTSASSGTNPGSINAISGITAKDMILLQVSNSNDKTPSPPSGFTLVESIAGSPSIYVYAKEATSSEPASYDVSWTTTGGTQILAMLAFYSDAGQSLAVDVHDKQTNTSSANRTFPSLTTTRDHGALAYFAVLGGGLRSTADASCTEKWDYDNFVPIYAMIQADAGTSGSTGTRTATGSATTSKCISVALYELTPPTNAPSGLTATASSTDGQIDLAFVDNSSNETGFEIERSNDGSTGWTLINTNAANDTTYTDTGLSEHVTRYYRVRAINADGSSGYSNTASATTNLIAPTSLTATGASSTQVNLSWTDNSGAESGYKVEQSPNGSTGWAEIATKAANSTSHSVIGLTPNVTYYWRVRAYAGSDVSIYSNTASATPSLAAPSGLSATVLSIRRVQLDWTDNDTDGDGFEIHQSLNSMTGFALIATVAANVETYTVSGLDPETTYYWKVRAFKG